MAVVRHVCGVMVTITTYGTWLRGDERGWAEDSRVFPASPRLESHDRTLLKYPPFVFDAGQLLTIGQFIGDSLMTRLRQRILALTVQTWHVHFVVAESDSPISDVVKCAKDAVCYGLRPGRPIWTDDYDKRFCFDRDSLRHRVGYVERHNLELGFPARPWSFIVPLEE